MRFDTANFPNGQGHIDARNIVTRFRNNDRDALASVRCAADDLQFAFVGRNLAQAQAIGVWVLNGADHFTDGKSLQTVSRIFDAFHLETEVGQGFRDFVNRGGGLKMFLEPGQREFHGFNPSFTFEALLPHLWQRGKQSERKRPYSCPIVARMET